MNSLMRRIIMEKQRDSRRGDRRNMDYGRGQYEGEFRGEYDKDYARDYAYDEEDMRDGRRGVKGTGPYGIGGRRYYPSRRRRRDYASYDMASDYADYADYGDYGDYERDNARYDRRGGRDRDYAEGDELKLSNSDKEEWKSMLENADGTHGEHFSLPQIKQVAQALGIQMRGYDETDLCLAANMLYSDYCNALKQFVPKDKEAMVYAKMAKAFLEDSDASVQGKEKLAAYYYAIVSQD